VNVHPAVSSGVDRLAPISFPDSVRMNNPHRNHS
jgi:hypothetical protein